ncbi:MAG: N-acetyl-gamma-glutamyl-phosphate reductase [Fibrobacteres bacterium]|nr:N-acetyl-gamma-glutamyl-phosphate reductase [Fibrobacterota bacterium]
MARIGILGATGYTGVEISMILERHPEAEIAFISSEASAGQGLSSVFPRLSGCRKVNALTLRKAEECTSVSVDAVFSCLPHGASAEACLPFVAGGASVVDLSADFRLRDPEDYPKWYGKPHPKPESLADAVYCIPELHRSRLAGRKLVASPGCYPTSVLLPLVALLRSGVVGNGPIIADSKSGVSGAGRKATLGNSFCEVNESLSAYKVGHNHQHMGEMRQEIAAWGAASHLVFSPHLVPMQRGILTTLYVPLAAGATGAKARTALEEAFPNEPFVKVLGEKDGLPATGHVAYSNRAHLAVSSMADESMAIVVCAIDNLLKGAAGQAVQNWNAMAGLDETMGLTP